MDEFKRIAHEHEQHTDDKPKGSTKRVGHRQARARIKHRDKKLSTELSPTGCESVGIFDSCGCVICQFGKRCVWCNKQGTDDNPVGDDECHDECRERYDTTPPGAWP